MQFDERSNRVIGCALEVHRELGLGLLASTYEQCRVHDFNVTKLKSEIKRFVLRTLRVLRGEKDQTRFEKVFRSKTSNLFLLVTNR